MALTYVTYTGDGTTNEFLIPFDYIKKEFLHVYVDEEEVDSADITWDSATQISLLEVPASGSKIFIQRKTEIEEPLVDFRDGSTLTEDELDTETAQLLHLIQENNDVLVDKEDALAQSLPWLVDTVDEITTDSKDGFYHIGSFANPEAASAYDASGYLVTASGNGGTAARTLGSRFGDFVNVMDFGAKGNGTTDDTEAFRQAGATGRPVFVPQGTYNVTEAVDGYFWSLDNVVIPYTRVWCKKFYEFQPKDFTGTASSIGGDYPNLDGFESNQWDRASQCGCCDLYSKILYIPGQVASGGSFISVIKWSEDESERVLLARSNRSYGLVCHQCLNIYRPTAEDDPVFICAANTYTGYNTQDTSRNFTINFLSYDYETDSVPTLIKTMEAFSSSEASNLNASTLMNVACSPDGAVMVASAMTTDGYYRHRVWDLHAIMMGKITSLLDTYMYDWTDTVGEVFGGQGTWTDGRYIYSMSGASGRRSYSTSIRHALIKVSTFDGKFLGQYFVDTTSADAEFFSGYAVNGEFEGIFLAPWKGRLVPVLMSSQSWYNNTENLSFYKRYNRYSLPTVSLHSSEEIFAGSINLQGEMYAISTTGLGNHPASGSRAQNFFRQRILYYGPTGEGEGADINVAFGCEAGTTIAAGEVFTALRAVYQEAAYPELNDTAPTVINAEVLRLLSDGRIVLHGGASEDTTKEVLLELTDRMAGFHVNSANNCFIYNTSPLLNLSYKGVEKGTVPESAVHARIAFSSNAESAAEGYHYATLYHYLDTDNSQRLDIGMYDASVAGGDLNHSLALTHNSTDGFVNKMQANLVPWNGNTFNIGSDGNRWDNGYFHTSVGTESDARVKQQIEPLEDVEKRVAIRCKSLIKKYKFNEAVERKGVDNARIHVGIIAQELKTAFEEEGLDAERYGILCHASWEDEYESRVVQEDENGNILETERVLVRPAGDGYSIRYEELLCFIIAAM